MTTSADSELRSSLISLRSTSRALVRDASYAKRAKVIVQNNIIGSGIGMQAQVMSSRDTLREDVNDAIETAFDDWAAPQFCHTGGVLHFSDFERLLMGEVFDAGEIFVRKHYASFGDSPVPFALEVIESERIADEMHNGVTPVTYNPAARTRVTMGIEQDAFGRPINYLIKSRYPGDHDTGFYRGSDFIEVVPASLIIHLRLIDRWPQTRGEPWLHAAARKLTEMDAYTEAEVVAARGAANYMGSIETEDPDSPLAGGPDERGEQRNIEMEPGVFVRPAPGESVNFYSPNRPNTALDPFMRYMIREFAAGANVSYESVSRDYSQSNFSSSRLALLDDRDLWRMLQQWFIRSFRNPIHKEWLQQAVLSRSIPGIRIDEYALAPQKFSAVMFKPRGWGWIDPEKEVDAYFKAVKYGFTTVTNVISQTGDGRDVEDVLRERERELKMMDDRDLEFESSPSVYVKAAMPAGRGGDMTPTDTTPPQPGNEQQQPKRVASLLRST